MYKKILFINPFGIGDVLFTTPIIHAVKDTFPNVKIGYLCNRRTSYILENNPYIDYTFIYERDEFEAIRKESLFAWLITIFAFLNRIKKEHFDIAIDFSLNTQYSFFGWYAGIRTRIGYDYKNRGWLLTKKIKLTGYDNKHIVEYYSNLLRLINARLTYNNVEIYLSHKDTHWAEEFLNKSGINSDDLLVAIIPGGGASWGRDAYLKHWPFENFAELADKIIENYPAKIIIMGDFFEKEIAQQILAKMKNKAIDLSGRTTLSQLSALLSKMNLVIANDGGPLHIAAALGKKTISFFGPVDPRVYGPYPSNDKRHIVLNAGIECSPCYFKFRLPICQKNKQCLEKISVEEASNAVHKLLVSENN